MYAWNMTRKKWVNEKWCIKYLHFQHAWWGRIVQLWNKLKLNQCNPVSFCGFCHYHWIIWFCMIFSFLLLCFDFYILIQHRYNHIKVAKQICGIEVSFTQTFFLNFLSYAYIGMSRKFSSAVEYLYPHHNNSQKHLKWIKELCILNLFHQIYEKSHHLQHLKTLLLHASKLHFGYKLRQVTLEADIPLQQLSTHHVLTSWMIVCCNLKDVSGQFVWNGINFYFCMVAFCNVGGETITNSYPYSFWRYPNILHLSLNVKHLQCYQDCSSIGCWLQLELVNLPFACQI